MRLLLQVLACVVGLALVEFFPLTRSSSCTVLSGLRGSFGFLPQQARQSRRAAIQAPTAAAQLRLRGGGSDDNEDKEPDSSAYSGSVEDEATTMRAFGLEPIPDQPEDEEATRTEYLSADTNIGRWGWTALHRAACAGDAETLKKMISMGGEVNAETQSGWTPLHEAANWGRVEAAKVLLSNGADVNQTNKNDWTALHFAAGCGQVEVTKLLLDAGIDRDATDNYGDKAVDKALRSAQRRYPFCPPGGNMSLTTEERRQRFLDAAGLLLGEGAATYEPTHTRFDVYAKLLPGRRFAYDLEGLDNASYVNTADEWMDDDADAMANFRMHPEDDPDYIDWGEVRTAAAGASNATDLTDLLDELLLKDTGAGMEEKPPTAALEGVLDEEVKAEIEGWRDAAYEERISNPKGMEKARAQEMWERDLPEATAQDKTEPALRD